MSQENGLRWQNLADDLRKKGGLPERRAEVVALVATGRTHQEVADLLGFKRGAVGAHISRYRDDIDEAEWLVEHAPDV